MARYEYEMAPMAPQKYKDTKRSKQNIDFLIICIVLYKKNIKI